jgi:hypothetical protein
MRTIDPVCQDHRDPNYPDNLGGFEHLSDFLA